MRWFFVFSLGSAALAGCLQAENPHEGAVGGACTTEGIEEGNRFIGFNFPNCEGTDQTFQSVVPAGNVVLFNISAGWCAPCRAETPEFQTFFETHQAQGLSIVQVLAQTDDSGPATDAFCQAWTAAFGDPLTFDVLFDPTGTRSLDTYFEDAVAQMPLNLIVDRSGCVAHSVYGAGAGWEGVETELLDLL